LVIVMLVHAASAGWPDALPDEPWLYAGGAIGCIFIAGQAVLVRIVGVLVLALCGVAGQLAAALSLDLLLPAAPPAAGPARAAPRIGAAGDGLDSRRRRRIGAVGRVSRASSGVWVRCGP